MNLARASIVVRQRGVLEVLDLACRFVVERGSSLYLRLAALVLLPCVAFTFALARFFEWSWFWVWVVALPLGSVAQAPFTIAVGRLMFSEQVAARAVLAQLARRSGALLGALFLARLLIVLAWTVVVLAPFAWVRSAFTHEAVLLEGASAREAVGRAARFVHGHGRTTFEMLLCHLCVVGGAIAVGEAAGHGLLGFVLQLGEPFGSIGDGGSLYALCGFFAAAPLVATARFLAYVDARTRRDGWDVQVRFMALAAAEEERVA